MKMGCELLHSKFLTRQLNQPMVIAWITVVGPW